MAPRAFVTRLPRGAIPLQSALATGALLLPLLAFLWLVADPARNPDVYGAVEHFAITTNVAALALGVAILIARAALQLGRYRILLDAVGFMSLAGFFLVHAALTPGVLVRGPNEMHAAVIIGVSAQLSLSAAAALFAARHSPLAGWLEPRVPPAPLVLLVLAVILAYGAMSIREPQLPGAFFGQFLPSEAAQGYVERGRLVRAPATPTYVGDAPLPLVAGLVTVALLGFAAWRRSRDFLRSRLPTDGTLVVAYLLLGEAQLAMTFGPIGTLAWWEYHGLMLLAVVIALGALFLELDRRRGLERFLPSPVVERVLTGDALRLAGERKVVTILFADLRGSTALAEQLAPEAVVGVLNAYLGAMARSVFAHGGILDKFLGDGLMAVFGVLDDGTNGAAPAARAALEIRRVIAQLNGERIRRGEPEIRYGIGIHIGEVVLGAVGLPERSDYTAIGDAVNTASRMESLTKEFGVDTVLSADAAARVDGVVPLRPLGAAQVKGKAAPIEVFTLG